MAVLARSKRGTLPVFQLSGWTGARQWRERPHRPHGADGLLEM